MRVRCKKRKLLRTACSKRSTAKVYMRKKANTDKGHNNRYILEDAVEQLLAVLGPLLRGPVGHPVLLVRLDAVRERRSEHAVQDPAQCPDLGRRANVGDPLVRHVDLRGGKDGAACGPRDARPVFVVNARE